MRLLLNVKSGKRPGTNGVCGEAYKLAAVILAPIFLQSFEQLKSPGFDPACIPEHIFETLWSPAAKKVGANTIADIRDLEIPSEDTKLLERILALLLEESAGPVIREHNEAFVSGGDITVNLFTMHEHFHRSLSKRQLHFLLLLDCAKGFNLL